MKRNMMAFYVVELVKIVIFGSTTRTTTAGKKCSIIVIFLVLYIVYRYLKQDKARNGDISVNLVKILTIQSIFHIFLKQNAHKLM